MSFSIRFRCLKAGLLTLAFLVSLTVRLPAQTYTLTNAANTAWGISNNWSPNGIPNGIGVVATITNSISSLTNTSQNIASGGAYPYVFGTLNCNLPTAVGVGATTANDQIKAAVATGVPIINVVSGGYPFFGGVMSGSQGFIKTGPGNFTFRYNFMAQPYAGTVTIAAGTLELQQDSSLGNSTNVVIICTNAILSSRPSINNQTLLLPGTRRLILNAAGGAAQLGTYNGTFTNIVQGVISESGSESGLTITGAGTVELDGVNTYTGPTTIASGTLRMDDAGQLGSGAYAASITNNGRFVYNSSANQTLSGVIAGTGSLTLGGSGTLTLSGANTYAGATTINSGTLALGLGGSLAASSSLILAAGATFDISGLGASATYSLGGSASLTANGNSADAIIQGGANGTVNLGTRPINLNYDSSNPPLTISQGTLSLSGQTITVNDPYPLPSGTYNLIQVNSGKIIHSGSYTLAGNATNGATGGTLGFTTNAGIAYVTLAVTGSTNFLAVGSGLRGDYFNSLGFTNLVASKPDGPINFNWGGTLPVAGLGTNYSVRWSGQVLPLYSETYTFYVSASTGARIWVNDKLLTERIVTMTGSDMIYGTIPLVAGRSYNLMVEYICNGATNARVQLAWSSPSLDWQVISSNQLSLSPLATSDTGSILDEFWLGLAGTNLTTLTGNANYPDHPTGRELLTTFESLAPNWTTNLGTRVSGWLVPLTNGNYTFAVAAADNAQLWLSTNAVETNEVLIASVPSASGFRQFTTFTNQKSLSIPLVGGQKYFIELRQKAATNAAYYSVAWQPPGAVSFSVIPGDYLAPNGLHTPQPDLTHLFDTLASGHPRILTSLERFAWLRQCIASNSPSYVVSTWLNVSNSAAAVLADTSLTGWEVGNDVDIEVLGMAYFVTGKTNYAEQAWLEMSNACNLPNWNNSNGLTQGGMCKGMGLGYDWFYDYLTPARRSVITNGLLTLGVAYNQPMYPNYAWYLKTSANNWAMVFNNGSVDMAIALADEAPATSQLLLASALNSMRPIMGHFTTDNAAYFEGQNYWSWGVTHLIYMLAGLQSSLGTQFSLDDTPGFDDTALFELYNTGPTKLNFPYADAGTWHIADVGLNWLSTRYNRTSAAWWRRANPTYAASFEDLFWYDGRGTNMTQSGYSPDNCFRGATATTSTVFNPIELSTARTKWDDANASFLAFKAGGMNFNSQGGTHDRIDAGSFVFDALGHRWIADLGEGSYSNPQYFDGTQRWWVYRCRAEGHNTLVLNPEVNTNTDQVVSTASPAASPIIYHSSAPTGDATVNIADLTSAYAFAQKPATRVWRGTKLFNNRNWLLVQDEIVSTPTPQNVWWFSHFTVSGTTWGVSADGSSVTLTNGSNKLWIKKLAGGGTFAISNAAAMPTSPPETPGYDDNTGYKKVALNLTGVTNTTIAVLMVPLKTSDALPVNLPAIIPLASWPTNTSSLLLNTPPLLAAITNRAIIAGANLSVASQASDTNKPPQPLAFLLPTSPAGASINPTSGVVNWRPAVAQSGTSNQFTVVVTNTSSLAATQSFWVGVITPQKPLISAPGLAAGQFGLTVVGDAGPDYTIQGATNLASPVWQNLITTNSPAMPFQWTETNTTRPQFYYRILLGP